jgi:lipoprotein-anchoring transpeptidase ErfK/SrfK
VTLRRAAAATVAVAALGTGVIGPFTVASRATLSGLPGQWIDAVSKPVTTLAARKKTVAAIGVSSNTTVGSVAPSTVRPTTPPKPLSARTAVQNWDTIGDTEWPSNNGSITARALNRAVEVFRVAGDRTSVLSFIAGRSVAGQVNFLALGMSGDWVRVAIPLRPNGTVGWVRKSDVLLIQNSYRIVIELATNRMRVYDGDKVLVDANVAAGTGGTPTPTGLFFLKELVPQSPGGALGPYAFGLSGYSDVLTSFNGGEGTIGLHGTNNPGKLGTNVSHGCVRVDNVNISTMARSLPLGTPVEVVQRLSDAPPETARRTVEWAFGIGGAPVVPAIPVPIGVETPSVPGVASTLSPTTLPIPLSAG